MSQGRGYQKWWLFIFALLIIAIIAGGAVLIFRQWGGGKPVEITLPSTPASTMEIYLSGAIAYEGIYTFSQGSSLRDVLQRAGGVTEEADLASIEIHIPTTSESFFIPPQKININTAEAWLLEALDGIGEEKAQSIIRYREEYGEFRQIEDLKKVSGIGEAIFEKNKDKITVVD